MFDPQMDLICHWKSCAPLGTPKQKAPRFTAGLSGTREELA